MKPALQRYRIGRHLVQYLETSYMVNTVSCAGKKKRQEIGSVDGSVHT